MKDTQQDKEQADLKIIALFRLGFQKYASKYMFSRNWQDIECNYLYLELLGKKGIKMQAINSNHRYLIYKE